MLMVAVLFIIAAFTAVALVVVILVAAVILVVICLQCSGMMHFCMSLLLSFFSLLSIEVISLLKCTETDPVDFQIVWKVQI